MSTIERTINLNMIEPAPLSLKAPDGMETVIAINFRDQAGNPITFDVAAQLQLTGKTSARTTVYAVPSTDRVNGRAQAVIPAGDLTDVNGYRLRLFGTVNQQPAILALGDISVIESAGMAAMPTDIIDDIDITLQYGAPATIMARLWQDEGKNTPFDIDTVVITASIYESEVNTLLLADFTVTKIEPNMAQLDLDAATVDTLPARAWWELRASQSGTTTTLAQGDVYVMGTAP